MGSTALEGHAAVVGAGVIGSAWAARFALHGVDVMVSDPNPDAPRKVGPGRTRAMVLACRVSRMSKSAGTGTTPTSAAYAS